MALFYEATTSGLNFDRFTEDLFGDSTRMRMKQAFWSAKQLLREKLGKREDEHILAADAELDLNLQQFYQIKESTKRLLEYKSKLHREFSDLSHLEFDFTELLVDCKDEKKHLQRVMQMTANSFALCAKERQNLLILIVRFYNELNEFYERAVLDCAQSVEAVEKARLDYRGSLLWMKKCSDALDPELRNSSGIEDFRAVQNVVKANKRKLDLLKEDITVKVDTLRKARIKLFDELLNDYKSVIFKFYEKTADEFTACTEEMAGLESYEIDVLKILNDPIKIVEENQKERKELEETNSKWKFSSNERIPKNQLNRRRMESENTESLIELDDVEEETEVCEPAMDRIRDLFRFDDEKDEENEEGYDNIELNLVEPTKLNLLKHSNEIGFLSFNEEENWKFGETTSGSAKQKHKKNTDLLLEIEETFSNKNGECSSSNNEEKSKIGNNKNVLLEESEFEDLLNL
ncbi:hypothetical protein ACQ4LE_010029 [Meloidogyne hapla]|uniref:AH domain-containing protein n=1 Tax=Meloidogyne hapla TaxID=6305 RepID=A0A1I8BXM6_MELHA